MTGRHLLPGAGMVGAVLAVLISTAFWAPRSTTRWAPGTVAVRPIAAARPVSGRTATTPAGPAVPARPAASAGSAVPGDGAAWRWPLQPRPHVIRGFDPPDGPWGAGHRGVDLGARPGQPVYAAGSGRIGYAGRLAGRGVITVVHGALRTTYLPVNPALRAGQRVAAGGRIGVAQNSLTHCGIRNCLHWGLLRGSRYLDPLDLLGRGPVRLLPVWGLPGDVPVRDGGHSPDLPADAPANQGSASPVAAASPVASPGAARRTPPPPAKIVPVAVTSAAAGGASAALLVVVAAHLARDLVRSARRRRLPVGVIDFAREREKRRGSP